MLIKVQDLLDHREDLYFNVSIFGIVSEIPALPYIEAGLLFLIDS